MKTTLTHIRDLEQRILTGLANLAHARMHGKDASVIAWHVAEAEVQIAEAQAEFGRILNTI